MKLYELNALIEAVCPVISINSDGVIVFDPSATPEQQAAAQQIMDANLSLLGGPPSVSERRAAIQDKINALEFTELLPRVTREGLLLTMETFAGMQGVTPEQLYLANIGYHKVKDFDSAITALRIQMEAIV